MEAGSEQRPPRRGLGARLAGALGRRAPVRPQPPQPETAEEDPATAAEAEWLESAVQEFERRLADVLMQAGDDLYAQVERDLAATEERLRASERRLEDNLAERLEGAVAEIRVQRDAQLADEIKRVRETAEAPLARIRETEAEAVRSAEAAASRAEKSAEKAAAQIESAAEKLGVRARRQELKLVREENSKRITAALVAQAVERLEGAVGRAEEAEERVREISDRVAATARRIAELGESAERAADLEGRIAAAVQTEADVARRITDAERRLLERIDPGRE